MKRVAWDLRRRRLAGWAAMFCLAAGAPLVQGAVALPEGASQGLRWAAESYERAGGASPVRCVLSDAAALGGEGYRLRWGQEGAVIEAAAWPGLMYGLLELARRARYGETERRDQVSVPALRLRAVSRNLEMWLGIPLYNSANRGYAPHDRNTTWWFHDEGYWRELCRRLAAEGLNGVVLLHPHLFPAFLDYSAKYPEAAYLAPAELAAKQRALRAAIRIGREYNVRLHWLRWNIWLPEGLAAAHSIAQDSIDTPLTREFEAWCVAEFYRAFPGFGSIIAQCGETPPGCTDFIRAGTVQGLRRVEPRPTLIVWSWCANPPDVEAIIKAYDGPTMVMNYLQYEQLFTPRPDPRIGRYSRAVGGAPMVALGGPKSGHHYLFWSDPSWARGLMSGLHRGQNGDGVVIEYTEQGDRWLAEEAFAHYAWNPDDPDVEQLWLKAISERYGDPTLARPLLTAMEQASRIIPRQVALTHSQSGAFMPQLGLGLLQCLEMPSLSSYVFENAVEIDAQGYLTPRLGKCWSSAEQDWGERVVPIRAYAIDQLQDAARRREALNGWLAVRRGLGFAPSEPRKGDTHPPAIAAELDELAAATLSGVDQVAAKLPSPRRSEELRRVLRLLRLNAALGRYLAAKDRAAIGWEVYRLTGSAEAKRQAAEAIDASLAAWGEYAEHLKGLYGPRLWGQVSLVNHPAPWSQLDLWHGYRNQAWEIDALTAFWTREAALVKERLATWPRSQLRPPLADELTELRADARIVETIDFEDQTDPRVELITRYTPQVRLTEDPQLVVDGRRSLLADSTGSEHEWNEVLVVRVPLEAGATYQVAVRYRVVTEVRDHRSPFAMFLRTPTGGVPNDQGDSRVWGGRPGGVRERVMTAELGGFGDYYLGFSIHGRAALVLDDIRFARVQPTR